MDTHTHYAVMTNVLAGALMIDCEKSSEGGYPMGDYGAYANLMKDFITAHPVIIPVKEAYGTLVWDLYNNSANC